MQKYWNNYSNNPQKAFQTMNVTVVPVPVYMYLYASYSPEFDAVFLFLSIGLTTFMRYQIA